MSVETSVNPRLAALAAAGTAPWLDQIRRKLIQSGELQRLIDEDSLRGVTSNPSIFEKAILGSSDYDDDVAAMAKEGKSAKEIYDALAIKDVQMGLDVLRPTWEALDHADGFVSLEVQPELARDTEGTLRSARSYWGRVDRPNLLIKIPGTDEGVPAIEQAIYEGINVNVTLLFAVEAYEKVAEAYIRGLERRLEEGKPLDVHSVASFFVSRVDTEVDKRLGDGHPELHGIAAIANARAAYQRFKAIFAGERWDRLAAAGAVVQRPLWASTSVKNPAYPETMYVDDLVAPGHGQHDADGHAAGGGREGRDHRAHRRPGPGRGPAEARRRRHRHGRRDPRPPRRRHRAVRGRDEPAHRRRRAAARGPRARSAAHDRGPHPRRRRGRRGPAGQGGPGRGRGPAHLAQGSAPVGRARQARDREPAGLADHHRAHARAPRRAARLRRGGQGRGLHRRRAAGHGRLVAGPGGPAAVVRRDRRRAAAAGARLHGPRRGAGGGALDRSRQDAVRRLVEVGRDDRDALALSVFLVSAARRRPLRRRHRPRLAAGRPGSPQRVPPRVRERPEHRRALQRAVVLRPRARGAHGHRRRRAAAPRPGGRGGVCGVRLQRVQRGPVAGAGDGRARAPGARQGDVRRLCARRLVRAVGGAARGRIHRQGGARDPARRRRAGRVARGLRRRPRVRLPAPRRGPRRRPRPQGQGAGRRRPPHGHAVGARADRPGPDLLLRRVRDRGGRLGPGDQPVRPAQRAGGQGQHQQGAAGLRRVGRAARRRRRRRRRAAGAAVGQGAAALPRRARLPPGVGGVRRRRGRPPRPAAAQDGVRDHVRLRAALPALHRPVPQGRADDRACSCSSCTTATRTWTCRAPGTPSAH